MLDTSKTTAEMLNDIQNGDPENSFFAREELNQRGYSDAEINVMLKLKPDDFLYSLLRR